MNDSPVMPTPFGEAIDQPQPLAQTLATGTVDFAPAVPADLPASEPPAATHEPEILSAAASMPSLAIAPVVSLAISTADSLKIGPATADGFAANTPAGPPQSAQRPARDLSSVGPALAPSLAIAPADSLAIAPTRSLAIGPVLPGAPAADGTTAVASGPVPSPPEPVPTLAAPDQRAAKIDTPAPAPAPSAPAVKPAAANKTAAKPDVPAKPDVVEGGIGILLVNLGTPDAPTPEAVRRYLKQFLTDPRVIERNSWLWRILLYGLILPIRSRRKARDYQKIWNNEKNESPFKTITRSQAEKLASILEPLGRHVIVDWAMRYGNPSIASRLEVLIARGCDRILVMPLYPQYAAPTTATVCDEVFRFMMQQRRQPALRILPPYYDDPYYIEVLASSLQAELRALPFTPDIIVASYHGMPKDYVIKGDPYEGQCLWTTQLLRQKLGFDETRLMMTFQSRFGRGQWLEPYTIGTVKSLAKKGVKNLVMLMPGFSADCLETLEEIAVENARVFKRYGGQNFVAIPCLNDSEAGMLMIWQLAMRELKGWV
jgi:ferrochelatase